MNNKNPENETYAGKRSFTDYKKGFVFSLLLTLLAFALVYTGIMPRDFALAGIALAAIIQILLQLHYFLGVGGAQRERWNLVSLIFTFLIMTIFIGGTLWVMLTLNYRMM